MKRQTAESVVDAYTRTVELVNADMPDAAKEAATDLYEDLRDYLVSLLSEEREDA